MKLREWNHVRVPAHCGGGGRGSRRWHAQGETFRGASAAHVRWAAHFAEEGEGQRPFEYPFGTPLPSARTRRARRAM